MKLGTFCVNSRMVRFTDSEPDDGLEGKPPFGGSDDDLQAINSMPSVMYPVTRKTVMVRAADVISDQPLKNGLCLRKSGVESLVKLAYGTGVHANHDLGVFSNGLAGLPLARCFRTAVVESENETWARMWFAFPRTSLTEEIVGRMDGGAIAENSASFYYKMLQCSICGGDSDMCAHRPNGEYDGKLCLAYVEEPQEYVETSLVWQGMANDTRFRVAAGRFDSGWMKPEKPTDPTPEADPEIVSLQRVFGPFEDEVAAKLLAG